MRLVAKALGELSLSFVPTTARQCQDQVSSIGLKLSENDNDTENHQISSYIKIR